METVTTWRMTLEYDGRNYAGWQRQPGQVTVQSVVQESLWQVLGGEQVSMIASGRTDKGVHALGQVVSFRATTERTPRKLRDGMNGTMPLDVACLEASVVPPRFHAQKSACGKLYRYVLRLGPVRSALRRGRCWQIRYALDLSAMQRALDLLVGVHDFTSFRATGCASRNPVREVVSATIREVGDEVWIEIYGKGFLRHMVRIIVGSLVDVGRGRFPAEWFAELIDARDREAAGRTALPDGLFLVRVDYPDSSLL